MNYQDFLLMKIMEKWKGLNPSSNTYPYSIKSLNLKISTYLQKNNPPSVEIKFFDNQKNIENINCFSNEGNNWGNPKNFS